MKFKLTRKKLRFITNKVKVNIWNHFGISKSQYVSLNSDEKLKMVKGFYKSLLQVYFGDGKRIFVILIVFGLTTAKSKIA